MIAQSPVSPISFAEAMDDPVLFGRWFSSAASWAMWRIVGKAIFGESMTPAEVVQFAKYTGRQAPPAEPPSEVWLACGRCAGKGWFSAAVAVFIACLRPPQLKPGELGRVMVLAADRDQAGETFRYISELVDSTPLLAAMVEARTKESIDLNNRIQITVQTASFRRIRGRKVVAAICDEFAFWYNEETSANPDHEILTALRPSMLGVPGALLVCISSPYARRGALWQAYKEHFGQAGDPVLIWKASTIAMHPGVDRKFLDREYERDPVSARAEYGAEFREDLESFVSPEAVDRVVVKGRTFLPFDPSKRHVAFCDPAGGSGGDSMTLAIARREDDRALLCRLVEWRPPFSPDVATGEAAEVLREYGLSHVVGDHYAGDWPKDRFRAHGIRYETADRTKSDFYQALLPLVNGQRVELLDHPRATSQLLALERSTSRLGKDSITHPPGGHDDLINAAAGALVLSPKKRMFEGYGQMPGQPEAVADLEQLDEDAEQLRRDGWVRARNSTDDSSPGRRKPTPSGDGEPRECPGCGTWHSRDARCPHAAPTGEDLRRLGLTYGW